MKKIAEELKAYIAENEITLDAAEAIAKHLEEVAVQIRKAAKAAEKKYHVRLLEHRRNSVKEYNYEGGLKHIKEMIILDWCKADYNKFYSDRDFDSEYNSIKTAEEAIEMAERVNEMLREKGYITETCEYTIVI